MNRYQNPHTGHQGQQVPQGYQQHRQVPQGMTPQEASMYERQLAYQRELHERQMAYQREQQMAFQQGFNRGPQGQPMQGGPGYPYQAGMQRPGMSQPGIPQDRFGKSHRGPGNFGTGPDQDEYDSLDGGRFNTSPSKQNEAYLENQSLEDYVETESPENETLQEFTVDLEPIRFRGNKSKAIRVRENPFVPGDLLTVTHSVHGSSLDEVIDQMCTAVEESEEGHYVCEAEADVFDTRMTTELTPYIEKMFDHDSRNLYRVMKDLFKRSQDVNELLMLDRLSDQLTNKLNDFLKICIRDQIVTIDSFIEDYNDLLKGVDARWGEEVLDSIESKMNVETETIKKAITLGKSLDDKTTKENLCIYNVDRVVYYHGHRYTLGLKEVDEMVVLTDDSNNNFLLSLMDVILDEEDRCSFVLVTKERFKYEFFRNEQGENFVKLIKSI